MKNVIMSQLYEIRKSRLFFIVISGIMLLCLVMCLIDYDEFGTSGILVYVSSLIALFAAFCPCFVTGFICAGDFPDKTINHEVTSGRLRKQVFFGRTILAIVFSVLIGVGIMFFVLAVSTALFSWGEIIPLRSYVLRSLLLAFPLFKLSCFYVMMSFIIKKPAVINCIGIALYMLFSIISQYASGSISGIHVFSIFVMMKLMNYDFYSTYGLQNDMDMVFDHTIDTSFVEFTVISSILIGIAYILIGYHFYDRDDLD